MKMKALQIMEPGQFTLVEVEKPSVDEHEVLVKIEIVATCPRWDINMLEGKPMFANRKAIQQYPLPIGFPGHEAAGTVCAVGAKVTAFAVGDRVAALEHLQGNGAYAQYLAYVEKQLIKLPDNVSFKQAVSFELLKCVVMGLNQFADLRGKSVLVSGLGPAGILAMQIARIWGASAVVGIDLSPERLDYVRGLQFGEVVHAEQLGDRRFDLGYDCVGFAPSIQNVLDHVKEHVVIFGVQKGEVRFGEHSWGTGLKLEAYRGRPVSEREKQLLLDAVANRGLNMECIQTHTVSFHEYDKAVELLKSQTAIKVHFYPGRDFEAAESSEAVHPEAIKQ
jgi:threonine dehydrogenase-like Zn-dependent dehydrogenase